MGIPVIMGWVYIPLCTLGYFLRLSQGLCGVILTVVDRDNLMSMQPAQFNNAIQLLSTCMLLWDPLLFQRIMPDDGRISITILRFVAFFSALLSLAAFAFLAPVIPKLGIAPFYQSWSPHCIINLNTWGICPNVTDMTPQEIAASTFSASCLSAGEVGLGYYETSDIPRIAALAFAVISALFIFGTFVQYLARWKRFAICKDMIKFQALLLS
jgi:hypothetical protein